MRVLRRESIILLIILIGAVFTCGSVSMDSANVNTTSFCVNFTGTSSHTTSWFEYGINHTGDPYSEGGYKSFATPNHTGSGTYSFRQCGIPFVSGQNYVVQAAGKDGNGTPEYSDNLSFVMPTVTPHVTTTYSQWTDQFITDMQDQPQNIIISDIWLPYTVIFGVDIFWGLIIGLTFFNMATKQRTTAMAILVLLLTGTTIFAVFPPEFVNFAEILFVIAIGGMFYWWFMRRR